MKIYFRNIKANEEMVGVKNGFVRGGVLHVAPAIFYLLKDDELKEIILNQLVIVDELGLGKVVEVFEAGVVSDLIPSPSPLGEGNAAGSEGRRAGKKMGDAIVTQYPLSETPGFAVVKFFDRGVMGTEFLVRVERVKCRIEN